MTFKYLLHYRLNCDHMSCVWGIWTFPETAHAHTYPAAVNVCTKLLRSQYVCASAHLTSLYTFMWLSRKSKDKGNNNVKWQWSIGWMDWDGGLTWPAPKNSSAVLTGGSTKTMFWPRSKRTYLYMLVLKSSWACWSGQESAHCSSSHCSTLSC